MTVDEVKKCSENGRNFISALMDLTGADVSATVQEKVFSGEPPKEEEERYTIDGKIFPHSISSTMNC